MRVILLAILFFALSYAQTGQFNFFFYPNSNCGQAYALTWQAYGVAPNKGCYGTNNDNINVKLAATPTTINGTAVNLFTWTTYFDSFCLIKLDTITMYDNQLLMCFPYYSDVLSKVTGTYEVFVYHAPACFPETAVVSSTDGEKMMKDLKVGDVIATKDGMSEVYTFLDRFTAEMGIFKYIYYYNENDVLSHIAMTEDHLILARRGANKEDFVKAKGVKSGDYVYRKVGQELKAVIVSHTETKQAKGYYGPATMEGTLVVDGIVTSSYALVDHRISHMVTAPLRLAYSISPSLISEQEGMNPYANWFLNTFHNWVYSKNAFFIPEISN
jgi:hypothetical protein